MTELAPGRRKLTKLDLQRMNLGKAFWKSRTDQIQTPKIRDLVLSYQRRIVEMFRTGSGLIFSGPPGVGKTSAAACVLKVANSAGFNAYMATHAELKELRFEKQPSMFGNPNNGTTVKRRIETVQFLALDGFNDQFYTDNVFGPAQLEELLIKRNSDRLVTIMTTRSTAPLTTEKYADLFEQVRQSMVTLPIYGKNLRDEAYKNLSERVTGDPF